jgi:hypothetical protein
VELNDEWVVKIIADGLSVLVKHPRIERHLVNNDVAGFRSDKSKKDSGTWREVDKLLDASYRWNEQLQMLVPPIAGQAPEPTVAQAPKVRVPLKIAPRTIPLPTPVDSPTAASLRPEGAAPEVAVPPTLAWSTPKPLAAAVDSLSQSVGALSISPKSLSSSSSSSPVAPSRASSLSTLMTSSSSSPKSTAGDMPPSARSPLSTRSPASNPSPASSDGSGESIWRRGAPPALAAATPAPHVLPVSAASSAHSAARGDEVAEMLVCATCKTRFPYTVSQKEFMEAKNFEKPKHCKPCKAKKNAGSASGGGGGAAGQGGSRGSPAASGTSARR